MESEMETNTIDKEMNETTPIVAFGYDADQDASSSPLTTLARTSVGPPSLSGQENDLEISSSVPQTTDELLHLNDNDVLCGRGSVINKHSGNRRFRRMIAANKADYASCEKNSHKYFLALSIVLAIERQGGRFVKRRDEMVEDSCLIVLTRKDAVAKTAQALRDQLHRGGSGNSHPCSRPSSTSPNITVKKQGKTDKDSTEGMEVDDGVRKINAQSCSDDGSSSTDRSSNDSSASSHSKEMDCDIGFSSTTFAMIAPQMFRRQEINATYAQPFPSSVERNHPTSMRDASSIQNYDGVVGLPSMAPGHEQLWIPEELEALIHSDPNIALALHSLE